VPRFLGLATVMLFSFYGESSSVRHASFDLEFFGTQMLVEWAATYGGPAANHVLGLRGSCVVAFIPCLKHTNLDLR